MATSALSSKEFSRRKERFIAVTSVLQENPQLEESRRRQLIFSILEEDDMHAAGSILASVKPVTTENPKKMTWLNRLSQYIFSDNDQKATEKFVADIRSRASLISDGNFLASLADYKVKDTLLFEAANVIENIAESHLNAIIEKATKTLTHTAVSIQREDCKKQFERKSSHQVTQAHNDIRLEFIHAVNDISSRVHELYDISKLPICL